VGIEWVRCVGNDCRTMLTFDAAVADPLLARSFVQQELVHRGILWNGPHTLSFAHGEAEIDELLAAYVEVLPQLDQAARAGELRARLLGTPVEAVFRRTAQFNTKPARAELR
jgi:hypothetical protein